MDLTSKKCIPCEGGIPPLNQEEIEVFRESIRDDWTVTEKLRKEFFFVNYQHTMDFVNKVAAF